ncbi:MAG: DUF4012 domain-containing protein [Jatrophihabitantaceae bacterium]
MSGNRLVSRLDTRWRYIRASGKLRRRVLVALGGLILLGAVWIVVTGLLAAQRARTLEAQLQQVKFLVSQGHVSQAVSMARDIPSLAHSAHRLSTGPAWWLAAQIPYFGEPVASVRGSLAAGDQIGSRGVPELLNVANTLDPAKLRRTGDSIDLTALSAARPRLQASARLLDAATRRIDALPSGTWLSQVDSARSKLSAQLHAISGYVDAAARAATVLPPMLGADGPKRYFVGLQNEAELRGTGGLPGAFAIVVADHGKITFTHFDSDATLLPAATGQSVTTGLDFGPGYDSAYGASAPTSSFVDSNASPNFPYAARIWAAMWEKVSGEHVDGALALDPTALGYFLGATGPAALPSGQVITSQNIVALTERDEYSIFSNTAQRKAFLVSVLKASSKRLTSGSGNALALARAMVQASEAQRLLAWSSDPALERLIGQTSYAGAIPQDAQPLVAPILNNAAAGKLDYYLLRTLTYHRSGCGSTRDVLATLTLTNTAPATGLSTYVTGRSDKNQPPGVKPGDNRTLLDYYATAGAQLLSVTLNGSPSTANVQHDLGHPIFRMDLELPRGTTQTIVFHLQEPGGVGAPLIWRQPGVTPLAVTAYSQPCG